MGRVEDREHVRGEMGRVEDRVANLLFPSFLHPLDRPHVLNTGK